MLEIEHFRPQIEERIGRIRAIAKIEKGFSVEKKFKVTSEEGDYLLRLSPTKWLAGKTREFELMKKLHENGVRCNNPITMFANDERETVCALYSYLPGVDAEESIAGKPSDVQYRIGADAGRDLKQINSLGGQTRNWKQRKWRKHEQYLARYHKQDYRLKNERQILRFVETHYNPAEAETDLLQHDDFHLGNIIIDGQRYVGILDFNRYDWGDPLQEFVKLEWFTWPVSEEFARGQVESYFGEGGIDEAACVQISVYIAMSVVSTVVWTLENYPQTWEEIESRMLSILDRFDYFGNVRPKWAG